MLDFEDMSRIPSFEKLMKHAEALDPKVQFKKLLDAHQPAHGYDGNIYRCQCGIQLGMDGCDIYGCSAQCAMQDHLDKWVEHFYKTVNSNNMVISFKYKGGW